VKVLDQIRDGTRVKKDNWLDRFEKRIGWDAETRKTKKEEKERKRQLEEDARLLGGNIEETGFNKNQSAMSLGNQISGSMKSIASRISSISNSRNIKYKLYINYINY